MGEKKWYRLVFFTFVVLGMVLIVIGASLTEPGTEELAYGTSGSFYIEDSHSDASIIVFTDNAEANCENFELTVDRRDGSYDFVPVEKTSCDRWSLPNSYQFRLHNLTEERYGFSASDTVTVVAVEGDLDAYMEDYASGNAIADLGAIMCCLSIILNLFIGRSLTKASKEQQVALNDGQTTFVQTASTVETAAPEALVAEQENAPGSFWGGIKDD